jgi:hypothetical protein
VRFAWAVLLVGCGAATSPTVDNAASGDAGVAASDASARDAAVPNDPACETLVLTFVGCDPERLTECEREYYALSPRAQGIINTDAVCFLNLYPQVAAAHWPRDSSQCSVAIEPPIFTLNSHWFHGGCQGDNASVAMNVTRDPSFPACGTGTAPACFFGGTIPASP